MKISDNLGEGPAALEELLSRKVKIMIQIVGWLGEMDLSVQEKSYLLKLIKNQCLSLARNQQFRPSGSTDKPHCPLIITRHN